LIIAGAGVENEMEKLQLAVNELSARDRIHLVGRVEHEVKDRLYREAVLVVIPSRFETFSLTALEALSYGIPAVGFDIDGLSAFPSDAVFKAEPFQVESLVRELRRALRDTHEAAFFQQKVEQYSWKRIVAAYRTLIETVS
jgi:glycosyltransferase involved in cell wall biosynthesis